jgi:peptide/nickel transport system permease protein
MSWQTSSWWTLIRRLARNRAAVTGSALFLLCAAMGLLAPVLAPSDPLATSVREALQGPTWSHPLGTDELGRDQFSRVLYGIQVSLTIGAASVLLGGSLGTLAGLLAGYNQGWPDRVIMRGVDTMLAFPGILLALAVVTVLGPGLSSVVVAVGIATIPAYVRVVRGVTLSLKHQDFVEGARSIGCTGARILFLYVLPNALSPIIVMSTLGMAAAILAASSLSYLGLGAQLPAAELGAMLAGGRTYLRTAWWLTVVPGGVILLMTLGINMLGDGLRDVLDPRLRV